VANFATTAYARLTLTDIPFSMLKAFNIARGAAMVA
jgi:hypothetical protein